MRTRPAILLVLLAMSVAGATCKGNSGAKATTPPARPDVVPDATGAAPAAAAEIPGVDISRIRPELRADFHRILGESSCYCGCPRTLSGCLSNKEDCSCVRCSERMVDFVIKQFEGGMSAPEVEVELLDGFSEGWNAAPKTFDLANHALKGNENAKYTIVEFADFRCGHCRAAFEPLAQLVAQNPDVKLVYFYFPLGGADAPGVLAAEAAEEARVQGKFWDYARILFENQHALELENLIAYAAMAGLDVNKLKLALDKHTHKDKVLADRRTGDAAKVESTPSIFVNGRPFGLGRTLENLKLRVDMESERGRCD